MIIESPALNLNADASIETITKALIKIRDKKQDAFLILSVSDLTYIQVEWTNEGYIVEYQEESTASHFVATELMSIDDVKSVLIEYLQGGNSWKSKHSFSLLDIVHNSADHNFKDSFRSKNSNAQLKTTCKSNNKMSKNNDNVSEKHEKYSAEFADYMDAFIDAIIYGLVIVPVLWLLQILYATDVTSISFYELFVQTCNSYIPYCSDLGHLGEAPTESNQNFIVYGILSFLILPFVLLPITYPVAFLKVSADRKCGACNQKWSVFFTGDSTLVSSNYGTINRVEKETSYRGGNSYTRDKFLEVDVRNDFYNDHYLCAKCTNKTERERFVQTELSKRVTAVGEWVMKPK